MIFKSYIAFIVLIKFIFPMLYNTFLWLILYLIICLWSIFPLESKSVSRSVLSDSATPWTVACQAPLSMGFSRQEYWSGLPFPSLGDLPTQGLNLGLLHCRRSLYILSHQGSSLPLEGKLSKRRNMFYY